MMTWIDGIIQGLLLGGLYALFATGLSLAFGIMRMVNIAHGDLIVLAAYLGLVVTSTIGLDPFTAMIVVIPAFAVLGYILQRVILNKTLGEDILPPLLVTFGLSILIQNGLLETFSADSQKLSVGALEIASFNLTDDLAIGVFPLLIFVSAVVVIIGLQALFSYTSIGRVFRATSDDPDTAQLMGLNSKHVYGLAMGLAMAVIALAGVYLSIKTTFEPAIGPARLIYAFEAVIIGGLGSLWGTLVGGSLLGISQAIGFKINPGWGILAGHFMFLIVLIFKPNGLFPKTKG